MSRTSLYAVPIKPMRCSFPKACPYHHRPGDVCDSPRTNKGNSDASCHRMNNRDLIGYLKSPHDIGKLIP